MKKRIAKWGVFKMNGFSWDRNDFIFLGAFRSRERAEGLRASESTSVVPVEIRRVYKHRTVGKSDNMAK